jgi:hypothetical protein
MKPMKDVSNWYLLQDGTYADPKDCTDKDGAMRHKDSGLRVAMNADGEPQTVGGGAVDNKNVEAAQVGESELAPPDVIKTEDIQPAKAEKPAEKAFAKPAEKPVDKPVEASKADDKGKKD